MDRSVYPKSGRYTDHDPHCKADPQGEAEIIRQDAGRWLSYGYVIARKPLRSDV